MNYIVEEVINKNILSLKKDLQDDIISHCRELLSDDESTVLNNLDNEETKVEEFLKIISTKSFPNLEIFISKLEPWYNWLHKEMMTYVNNIIPKDQMNKALNLGGVPNFPLVNITRTELLNKLKSALRNLQKGHYLVTYGMIGSGKTSLAVGALRDNDLLRLFGYQVYWLTVGSEGAVDPSALLEELNARLSEPLPQLSPNCRMAAIELNKRFIDKNWTDSLIVLDDVTDEAVLDCFAIFAKFLIITKDKEVISKKRSSVSTFLKIDEGFTEAESQQLFAQALGIDTRKLPHHASDIYKYTKGHPFSLSLFVSQLIEFKEDFLSQSERWDHYINIVLSKQKKRRRSMSETELFFKPIEESVNSLGPENQKLFFQLSVFQEDVNIKPEVLGTLWSLNKIDAESIMMKFVNKSLAVRKWNELQKSFVYGVHDLIGDFLKRNLTSEEEKDLHAHLVGKYKKSCDGNWSKLPKNDNYIFYYIGYHLKKAAMFDLFSKIYFDLKFLEAKLKVTGPGDLLRDYKKYRNLISNGEKEDLEKIGEYTHFIEHYGVWIFQGVNIIQLALQTPSTSSVHKCAKKLAKEEYSDQCYINCMAPSVEKPVPLTLSIKESITAVCFGKTVTEAIIASGKTLELYSFKTKSVSRRFSGHTGRINCLNISSSKSVFLSASMDNTIRVWPLDPSETSSGERTPSPEERQESYISFFGTFNAGQKAVATLEHNSAVSVGIFGKTSDSTIASLCSDGSISMWNHWSKIWQQNDYEFKSIDFSSNDRLLVALSSSKVYFLYSDTGAVVQSIDLPYTDPISISTILGPHGEGLALLNKRQLTFYSTNPSMEVSYPMDSPASSPLSKLCSVGPHIAVSTEDGSLFVYNSENGKQITDLQSQKKVVSFYVAERAILAGFDDGNVFQYPLESLMSLILLKWSPNSEPVIAKMDSTIHTIEVYAGNRKTLDFVIDDVEKIDVSEDGNQLVTANELGRIVFYDGSNDEKLLIIERLPTPTALYLLGTTDEQVVVISYITCSSGYQSLVWRRKTKEIIKLKTTSAIECAHLIDFKGHHLLITASPFAIWSLDGTLKWKNEFAGMIRIKPHRHLIAASLVDGLHLCQFNALDGIQWEKRIEDTNHIELFEFSPSGSKLALIETDGNIKVYDGNKETWKFFPSNKIMKKAVYLAVSDRGTVCYGGNGLVCIQDDYQSSTAVLDVTCVVADPSGEDIFAVTDKTGYICKIHLESFK